MQLLCSCVHCVPERPAHITRGATANCSTRDQYLKLQRQLRPVYLSVWLHGLADLHADMMLP